MEDKINYHLQNFLSEVRNMISDEVFSSVQKAMSSKNDITSHKSEILTIDEVVKEFKISKSNINNLRNQRADFPIIKINKAIRFDRDELKEFFKNNILNKREVN